MCTQRATWFSDRLSGPCGLVDGMQRAVAGKPKEQHLPLQQRKATTLEELLRQLPAALLKPLLAIIGVGKTDDVVARLRDVTRAEYLVLLRKLVAAVPRALGDALRPPAANRLRLTTDTILTHLGLKARGSWEVKVRKTLAVLESGQHDWAAINPKSESFNAALLRRVIGIVNVNASRNGIVERAAMPKDRDEKTGLEILPPIPAGDVPKLTRAGLLTEKQGARLMAAAQLGDFGVSAEDAAAAAEEENDDDDDFWGGAATAGVDYDPYAFVQDLNVVGYIATLCGGVKAGAHSLNNNYRVQHHIADFLDLDSLAVVSLTSGVFGGRHTNWFSAFYYERAAAVLEGIRVMRPHELQVLFVNSSLHARAMDAAYAWWHGETQGPQLPPLEMEAEPPVWNGRSLFGLLDHATVAPRWLEEDDDMTGTPDVFTLDERILVSHVRTVPGEGLALRARHQARLCTAKKQQTLRNLWRSADADHFHALRSRRRSLQERDANSRDTSSLSVVKLHPIITCAVGPLAEEAIKQGLEAVGMHSGLAFGLFEAGLVAWGRHKRGLSIIPALFNLVAHAVLLHGVARTPRPFGLRLALHVAWNTNVTLLRIGARASLAEAAAHANALATALTKASAGAESGVVRALRTANALHMLVPTVLFWVPTLTGVACSEGRTWAIALGAGIGIATSFWFHGKIIPRMGAAARTACYVAQNAALYLHMPAAGKEVEEEDMEEPMLLSSASHISSSGSPLLHTTLWLNRLHLAPSRLAGYATMALLHKILGAEMARDVAPALGLACLVASHWMHCRFLPAMAGWRQLLVHAAQVLVDDSVELSTATHAAAAMASAPSPGPGPAALTKAIKNQARLTTPSDGLLTVVRRGMKAGWSVAGALIKPEMGFLVAAGLWRWRARPKATDADLLQAVVAGADPAVEESVVEMFRGRVCANGSTLTSIIAVDTEGTTHVPIDATDAAELCDFLINNWQEKTIHIMHINNIGQAENTDHRPDALAQVRALPMDCQADLEYLIFRPSLLAPDLMVRRTGRAQLAALGGMAGKCYVDLFDSNYQDACIRLTREFDSNLSPHGTLMANTALISAHLNAASNPGKEKGRGCSSSATARNGTRPPVHWTQQPDLLGSAARQAISALHARCFAIGLCTSARLPFAAYLRSAIPTMLYGAFGIALAVRCLPTIPWSLICSCFTRVNSLAPTFHACAQQISTLASQLSLLTLPNLRNISKNYAPHLSAPQSLLDVVSDSLLSSKTNLMKLDLDDATTEAGESSPNTPAAFKDLLTRSSTGLCRFFTQLKTTCSNWIASSNNSPSKSARPALPTSSVKARWGKTITRPSNATHQDTEQCCTESSSSTPSPTFSLPSSSTSSSTCAPGATAALTKQPKAKSPPPLQIASCPAKATQVSTTHTKTSSTHRSPWHMPDSEEGDFLLPSNQRDAYLPHTHNKKSSSKVTTASSKQPPTSAKKRQQSSKRPAAARK